MRILPYGATAALVELADLDEVLRVTPALDEVRDRLPGLLDIVPAERTVLLTTATPADLTAALETVGELIGAVLAGSTPRPVGPATEVIIPIRYDGPDLDDVARHTGGTVREVIAAHEGATWTVAFCGFAPGFGYLVGGDPTMHVPRRADPRPLVPAGAVGLAGRYCGIYPRPSPGGWQIIGRTEVTLFDPRRDPPALLPPGATVRFAGPH